MSRGIKKHYKRLNAPKKWLLSKLGGIWAPRSSSGPHKKLNSIPLVIVIRNKFKYSSNQRESLNILKKNEIYVDGKVRNDKNFPAGVMDVISIKTTKENYRVLYDNVGHFFLHRITLKESMFKLCKVIRVSIGSKGIPYIVTHDGRTIRFPNLLIKSNDSIVLDLLNNKVIDFIKFCIGSLCVVIKGSNIGRIGVFINTIGGQGFDSIVCLKDFNGSSFSTQTKNLFVIGKGTKSFISLPRFRGLRTLTKSLEHNNYN